jgi:hypothetical protein
MTTRDAAPHGGHETRDVSARPILLAGIGLAAALLATSAGAWWLLGRFQAREARRSAEPSPLVAEYGRTAPPAPRLQTDPLADLRALRAEEDALLHRYAWVDRETGRVRIPIEQAIDLLVARADPSRTGRTR